MTWSGGPLKVSRGTCRTSGANRVCHVAFLWGRDEGFVMISRQRSRNALHRLIGWALALTTSACVQWAHAATPPDLDRVVEKFKTTRDPSVKLDLAYKGLDLYAPITKKSTVDPDDRGALSEMKHKVITDLMKRARKDVLVSAIGSTGNWLMRPEKVKNDYDAGEEVKNAKLKAKGYYMEGLSDLDFVIMGPEARRFSRQAYSILAKGRGNAGLVRDELEKLEISFIVDDQIRSLGGRDRRTFWRQLLDVRRSAPHPEKYITKGGKALYGVEHLKDRGAAMRPADKPKPTEFKQWASSAGQDLGPFSAQYLFGGCCDMDYFIRHAWEKSGQEPIKTALQVLKYLRRQAWMARRARASADSLPGGLKISESDLDGLERLAEQLEAFAEKSMKDDVWKDPNSLANFKRESLSRSALSCSTAHQLSIDMGHSLLYDLAKKQKLSEDQAVMLQEIAYDLEAVDKNRYPGGRPDWYGTGEYSARGDTLEFLDRYKDHRRKVRSILIAARLPLDDPGLTTAEIGPIKPPPVATVAITQVQANPPRPKAGETVTFTITCEIGNLLEEEPSWEEKWLDQKQLAAMEEIGKCSWRAKMGRMQLSHLMHTEQVNCRTSQPEEKVYVSPYEIERVAKEEIKKWDEQVAYCAERLGTATPPGEAGVFEHPMSGVPTMQSLKEYLSVLEANCKLAKTVLEGIHASADALAGIVESKARGIPKLASAAASLSTARKDVAESIYATTEVLGHLQKYKGWAEQIEKIGRGDVSAQDVAAKLAELETHLEDLARRADMAVWNARAAQHAMVNTMLFLRGCARSLPQDEQYAELRARLKREIKTWDNAKNKLILIEIPKLEQYALWLSRGAWAASAARLALGTAHLIQDYHKTRANLANTGLSKQTEDAVLALKAVGQVIIFGADKIPIPVLRQVIKTYAGLLVDAPGWAAAFDKLVTRRYQGQGWDLRPNVAAACKGLISHAPDLTPGQYYQNDSAPFASYNRLFVFGYPRPEPTEKDAQRPRDMLWLIWDKTDPAGYYRLDHKTFKDASLYATWYRRVYGQPIEGPQLYALLKHKRIEGGLFFGKTITVPTLKRDAAEKLRLQAMRRHLYAIAGKKVSSPTQLLGFYNLLTRAADQLAAEGFILSNDDASRVLREPERRLEEAVAELVKKKVQLRADARRLFWEEAKKSAPAGLMLEDVVVNVDHTILWKGSPIQRKVRITPTSRAFRFTWSTALPKEIKPPASYVCRVTLMNHASSAYVYEHDLSVAPEAAQQDHDVPEFDLKIPEAAQVIDLEWHFPTKIPPGIKPVYEEFSTAYIMRCYPYGPYKAWSDKKKTRLQFEGYKTEKGWSWSKTYTKQGSLGSVSCRLQPDKIPRKDVGYYPNTNQKREVKVLIRRGAGKLASRAERWYPNGQKESQELVCYTPGERYKRPTRYDWAIYRKWYESGQMLIESIRYGVKRRETTWWPNGKVRSQSYMVYRDTTHGVPRARTTTEYKESGQRRSTERYQNGKKHGIQVYWREDGSKESELYYENGKEVVAKRKLY